jgi:hypothetical protein
MSDEPSLRFSRIRAVGGAQYAAFLVAGYKECYISRQLGRQTPFLLQKAIYRNGVRAFFINVWSYDFSEWSKDHPFGMDVETHFNVHSGQRPTFSATWIHPKPTPSEVERFFEAIYDRMECRPYDDDGEEQR